MNHKIPCEVISDLLPLYIDHLTSEVTGNVIQEHLSECEECTQKYQRMGEPVSEAVPVQKPQTKEIDYLKKFRKSSQKKAVLAVISTLLVVLAGLWIRFYCIGFKTDSFAVKILPSEDGNAVLSGEMKNPKYVYKKYAVVEKDGVEQLVVYACYRSPWNHGRSFEVNISKGEYDKELVAGSQKLLSDGTVISEQALELYRLRNPYIGNMPANGKISLTLGISDTLGQYLNQLQTSEAPYGWTLEFTDPITKEQEQSFNYKMTKYACELLALIQNVDSISWTYQLAEEEAGCAVTLTSEQAGAIMGRDIKDYYESELMVEQLLCEIDERMSQQSVTSKAE